MVVGASSTTGFFQSAPVLSNQYKNDAVLRAMLRVSLPLEHFNKLDRDLQRFGDVVIGEEMLSACMDAEQHPPELISFDAWGRRCDKLTTSQGWKHMKSIAASEGIIATAYEDTYGEHARLCQFAKYYLYAPSSAVYTCPLAMADGAARLLYLFAGNDPHFRNALTRLTSRDPEQFWTSGQWMTERSGGSDVSGTETVATLISSDEYLMTGFKFFSSATDSDMTFLLGRVQGDTKLSLFYAETRRPDRTLNGIRIQRLKPKLGTRAVPTAELELVGMRARMIGKQGRGVATIATLLNITRVHTAMNSVAFLRRALVIAEEYSKVRTTFGKQLDKHPMHLAILFDLNAIWRACMHLTFYTVKVLGASERSNPDPDSERLLRVSTPVTKAWVSKLCVGAISECVEALGGQGYMEDVGLARLLRDCQVNTIWEGTTNVLSLDLRKVLLQQGYLELLWSEIRPKSSSSHCCSNAVNESMQDVSSNLTKWLAENNARNLLYRIGSLMSSSLMILHATATGDPVDAQFAHYWCCVRKPMEPLPLHLHKPTSHL